MAPDQNQQYNPEVPADPGVPAGPNPPADSLPRPGSDVISGAQHVSTAPGVFQQPSPQAPIAGSPDTPVQSFNPAAQSGQVNNTDPTQPGYVPPAMPVSQPAAFSAGADSTKDKKAGKLRILIAAVVSLFVLAGGGYLVKDMLFSGSAIKTSDLVETTADSVAFKHPQQWDKIEEPGALAAYTEDGKPMDEADQGMIVMKESLGIDYDTLSQEQKSQLDDALQTQFTSANIVDDEVCKEATPVEVEKTSQPNYTDSYIIFYTCNEISGRQIKGTIKAVIGLKGREMHMVVLVAIDKTWDKSGDALDEILNSFKPA